MHSKNWPAGGTGQVQHRGQGGRKHQSATVGIAGNCGTAGGRRADTAWKVCNLGAGHLLPLPLRLLPANTCSQLSRATQFLQCCRGTFTSEGATSTLTVVQVLEGRLCREHLPHHDTKRVDVHRCAHVAVPQHLRGCVAAVVQRREWEWSRQRAGTCFREAALDCQPLGGAVAAVHAGARWLASASMKHCYCTTWLQVLQS